MRNVIIPNSVTTFNRGAFGRGYYYPISLSKESLESIDKALTRIAKDTDQLYLDRQQGELNPPIKMADDAFGWRKDLTYVKIRPGVTSIGDEAFSYCYNLVRIVIPSSVTSIGRYAFRDCENLKEIIIPESVTWIDSFAFDGRHIADDGFTGCPNLSEESKQSINEARRRIASSNEK